MKECDLLNDWKYTNFNRKCEIFIFCFHIFFRVRMKHHYLQSVREHPVYKCYKKIFFSPPEWIWKGHKMMEGRNVWEMTCWVVNIMYSHRYHGHGDIIFIPPSSKEQSVCYMCACVFCHMVYSSSHCGEEDKRTWWNEKNKNKRIVNTFYCDFFFLLHLLCYASQTQVVSFVIYDLWLKSFFKWFIYWFLLKLLACFDEANPLLYFAQSIFGEHKHKLIVSRAEKENYTGEYEHWCETEQNRKIM